MGIRTHASGSTGRPPQLHVTLSWLQVEEVAWNPALRVLCSPGLATPTEGPGMVETKDVRQLRQLSLELLRQLRAGQEAVRRSVAKAASAVSTHLRSPREGGRGCQPLGPESRPPAASRAARPLY